MSHVVLDRRALCEIEDVKHLVPGFTFDDELVDALIDLINGVSDDIHTETGREFVSLDAAPPVSRLFDLSAWHTRERKIRIGDCADVDTVEIVELDGTVLETVTLTNLVQLPRVRGSADPVRQLWFPATGVTTPVTSLACGRAVKVTGTFGFPEIPPRLSRAVARLVIVRYVSDVTDGTEGTDFANALGELNIAGLFRSARETISRFTLPSFA